VSDAPASAGTPPAPRRLFRVCVYCGSQSGHDVRYAEAARATGRALGEGGFGLVYGGGRIGLMGTVADAALAAGAPVLGVIPERLMARELGHPRLQELRVVGTMHERKHEMAGAADAFVALPGGLGTLEELFEVWTWHQLGYHAKPVGLLNVGGFFDPLLAFLRQAGDAGFIGVGHLGILQVDDDPVRLLARLRGDA
jgi:uncharacterized protein (TIGR00730 family)